MLFSLETQNRTILINEPRLDNVVHGTFEIKHSGKLTVVNPILPSETSVFERKEQFLELIKGYMKQEKIRRYNLLTTTCRSVPYVRYLNPENIDYLVDEEEAHLHPELFLEMAEYVN